MIRLSPGSTGDPCRPASRMSGAQLSEISRIGEMVRELHRGGRPVNALHTGEPDSNTPEHIIEAALEAALRGETHYTATGGTQELREAIAQSMASENGFSVNPSEVIVSTGAKQVLFNALMATLDDGDEVLLPTPFWASYTDIIRICGGAHVALETHPEDGFRLRPETLRAAITPKTRWLILNSPGNPSGAVLSRQDNEALAEVLREAPHVGVISDEIYQHICYVPFTSFRTAAPDLADRTLIVHGASKTYAMTGWRLGWGVGPTALIKSMGTVQGQVTAGASSISQAGALAALRGPQDFRQEQNARYRVRRDLVVNALDGIELLHCPSPDGAFYVFCDCTATFGKITPIGTRITDDAAFCYALLQEHGVSLVPGRAFGKLGYFRLSFACDTDSLSSACETVGQFCAALR